MVCKLMLNSLIYHFNVTIVDICYFQNHAAISISVFISKSKSVFTHLALVFTSIFLVSKTVMDVVYLLDGSETVPENVFDDMKEFVRSQLKTKMISPKQTRIGLYTIGENVQYLSPNGDPDAVESAIELLERTGGARRVDEALQDLEMKYRDFRTNAKKMVVLLLHGKTAREGFQDLGAVAKRLMGKYVCFSCRKE